jgi:pyrroline-5-carboxylate reductase
MSPALSSRVAFIGGGNMARSLAGGLIARGAPPSSITVSEPQAALRDGLGPNRKPRCATAWRASSALTSAATMRPRWTAPGSWCSRSSRK